MKSVLVIGGCGYIGPPYGQGFADAGHHVTVLDDLSSGYRDSLLGGTVIVSDSGGLATINTLFSRQHFDGVIHLLLSFRWQNRWPMKGL